MQEWDLSPEEIRQIREHETNKTARPKAPIMKIEDRKTPLKFRKKPVVIEAVQWLGDNFVEVDEFLGTHPHMTYPRAGRICINTPDGPRVALIGDWIIRGVSGEYYPCKPDIFEKTYDLV